ncbi:MAG: class I SAM-dependent methyltransferase [Pseudomonadota bacterium]|nr:class I SAM-dependent methyltransferase [Pseudomonadota bacterium]MDE3038049.1 class I SAM-dependent methyltransferase [Pseudomonadota bacterium]
MFDWTKLTKNPTDKHVIPQMQAFLASLPAFYPSSRADFLRDYFRKQRALDIGAGEHDAGCYNEDRWEHGIITKVASASLGVDINPEVCEHYTKQGYRFVCADATSEIDLGERFDRVFLGDVIEHVNNPVALLNFAKRHLAAGGKILISTPNPFCLSFQRARRKSTNRPFFMANFEHLSWVTPTNANELARRAGLTFARIYFPQIAFSNVRSPRDFGKALNSRWWRARGRPELAHKEYIYEFTA